MNRVRQKNLANYVNRFLLAPSLGRGCFDDGMIPESPQVASLLGLPKGEIERAQRSLFANPFQSPFVFCPVSTVLYVYEYVVCTVVIDGGKK